MWTQHKPISLGCKPTMFGRNLLCSGTARCRCLGELQPISSSLLLSWRWEWGHRLAQGKLIMEGVIGCFSAPLGYILSGKCCLGYEAGIPVSKFGSMYLMNYFYAHFPFPGTAMLTVWFADIYENGKEKTWSSSLTRPHISHIAEKTEIRRILVSVYQMGS